MAIRAISPIYWIKFLFDTHMIECPKDKIIIHRVLEKDIGSHLGSKGPKNLQKSPKICYFSHILGIRAISPIHWIKFLFGTRMIECPKDKIVIHRVSGEGYWVPLGLFFRSSGPLEPRHHPTYYSRNPMNDWISIETFHNVYTNGKFDSMYG